MELIDRELVGEFVVEAQEGLANVEQQLLAIEAAGANIDADLVNAVFRTMHSIKGNAGFLGLDRIGALAHALEEILNNLRNFEIVPTSELISAVLRSADFMKGLIAEVETSNGVDVATYVAELQTFRPGAAPAKPARAKSPAASKRKAGVAPVPESQAEPKSKGRPKAKTPAPAAISDVVRDFLIECHENLDQMDRDLTALEDATDAAPILRNVFRTMHTVKGGAGFLGLTEVERLAHVAEDLLSELRSGQRRFTAPVADALLAAVDKCREGLRLVEVGSSDAGFDPGSVIERLIAVQNSEAPSPSSEEAAATVEGDEFPIASPTPETREQVAPCKEIAARETAVVEAAPESPAGDKTHVSIGDSTIRVDVALLDKLMTRVGELVLARNQILQHTSSIENSSLFSTAQRLNMLTTELQESVMKTRMQPIGNVWSKFPRVVRDLASMLGKQVRIDMEGKETELDKTIVEAIKDPLTHLVRNAVDHGIESPESRLAAGKSAEGRLQLRAYHEGGQVNIEISDDGAGLNIDRIRKKAIERGLVSPDQAARMSDREAAQIILLPGFSTAEQVTSVSGRGVGMDVVKSNIERIGGMIDLQNRPGQGTTIRIKIPLTLAIIPALVVTNGGDRYAIPQMSLLELVRLEGEQAERGIEQFNGAPVYRLRGKLLPLVDLSESLRLGETAPAEAATEGSRSRDGVVNIVVLRANDRQFGLVVDRVNDTEEIVVKPLARQLKGIGEYAGATIMGDGSVALILDVMGLALAAGLAAEGKEPKVAATTAEETRSERRSQTLLVVDSGDSRRFALPTSMISRMEKVARKAIEYADGREVMQYRDEILPLVRLRDVFGAASGRDEVEQDLQIVVYAEKGHSYGLVVDRIVDVVETELRFDARHEDDKLLGTTVIQQRVVDVLNMRGLSPSAAR